MSEQPQTQTPVKKTKRAHKSGSAAAKQVRRQSKSSAPIFFEKTIVHMVKDHTPEGTRITTGARRLLRTIVEQRTVNRAAKAYAVTKARRGKKGNVRLITRDLDLVSFLLDNTPMPMEEEEAVHEDDAMVVSAIESV
jgi:hypothetical protein